MAALTDIAGIDISAAAALRTAGIRNVRGLLAAGASRADRRGVAAATGLRATELLAFVQQADLFRIKGVGGNYAVLLAATGIRSVPELAQRHAPGLRAAIEQANAAGEPLVHTLPSVFTVRRWIVEARRLPALVES